ncbi:MAG: sulfite reductase subunit alpha [Burkholderiaceae bacterium]
MIPLSSHAASVASVLALALALAAFAAVRAGRRRAGRASDADAVAAKAASSEVVLVLHASQTGTARDIAQSTGELLRQAGRAVQVQGLGRATVAQLQGHRHALFVLATTGDGDPPDEARTFARDAMRTRATRDMRLAGLSFGLLALGDSHYADFCGFGRAVDRWLRKRGARALFERVEIDGWDGAGLARWHRELGRFAGPAGLPAWPAPDAPESRALAWRIVARRVLNPGSLGEPMVHVELAPADGAPLPAWEAGDLARLLVPGQHRPRDYSIASVPADGRLHLVARRVKRRNGSPGAASGWLADAPVGSEASLRLVAHPSFRLGANAARPLILVANGAGIAGVRAHLRARAGRAGARQWLLYGERQRERDFHYRDEIERWQAQGVLERVDLAFSRDQPERVHVQQRLRESAAVLRDWVAAGAAVYVCGSRLGMGEGVHDALVEALGGDALQALAAEGRYRRDVY